MPEWLVSHTWRGKAMNAGFELTIRRLRDGRYTSTAAADTLVEGGFMFDACEQKEPRLRGTRTEAAGNKNRGCGDRLRSRN